MKRSSIIVLLSMLMSTVSTKVSAHDIAVDNAHDVTIYYNWIKNHTELSVTYYGSSSYKKSIYYSGEIDIPESVEYMGNTYPVTSIEEYAFSDCNSLTSVVIPNSVSYIGSAAFQDSELASVIIGNSVTTINNFTFNRCSNLTSVIIPNSVTTIRDFAFNGCYKITSLIIPNSVSVIENDAFNGCSGLTSLEVHCKTIGYWSSKFSSVSNIIIGNEVSSIAYGAFKDCISLTSVAFPNSVTTIGNSAFSGCTGLTSVTIPNNVSTIGDFAFSGCSNLSSITIPNSVINLSGFNGCSSLSSISIPNSVTSLGNSAFEGCTGLTSVTFPNSVSTISNNVFAGCSGLTSVTILCNPTSTGSDIFKNCVNIKEITFDCEEVTSLFRGFTSVEKVTMTENVTSIKQNAFSGCSGLISITIPKSITSIGLHAFLGCNGLTKVNISDIAAWCEIRWPGYTSCYDSNPLYYAHHLYFDDKEIKDLVIPSGVTIIKDYAFCGCLAFESITLPEGVTSIGSSAFENCGSLSSLTIPSSVTSIGTKAFFYEIDASTVEWGGQKSRHLQVNISDLAAWCNIDFGNNVFNEVDYYYDKNEQSAMRALAALQRYSLCLNGQNMGELEIPKNVTEIKKNAFAYCRTTIKLHDGITSIGDNAFRFGYVSPSSGFNGVKRIGDYAFEYSSLSSIEFGEGLTSIGKYALSNTQIQSIVLPSTIESLGNLVFLECKRLSNVVLPNSLKSLPNGAFENCTSLKMMRLPSSLTSMGNGVFLGCSNMEYLIFTSESLPSFTYLSDQTLLVIMPQAAYEKGFPNTIKSFVTYNSEPMFVEVKSKGATSAVFDVYPINDDGSLDEKNMATATTVGQTPGQYLNWELDKDNYGIISEKANETVTLTVQEPKVLSTIKARLLATTEEADDFEHYGFEWRQYDAPEGRPSNKVSAPLYNGRIVGTLNNLNPDKDYMYRPYYKSNDGTMFYGEWIWLYTGDADVFFEPEVYTKDAESITKVSALLAGIWFEGTDDIEEKGFEYWILPRNNTRAAGGDVQTVVVSGNKMTATIEGLKPGATYAFRSYAKTASDTTYGEEKTFKTILIGDVDGDGVLTKADTDAIAKHIIGQTPTGFNMKMADVNDDGDVNATDIVLLINMSE